MEVDRSGGRRPQVQLRGAAQRPARRARRQDRGRIRPEEEGQARGREGHQGAVAERHQVRLPLMPPLAGAVQHSRTGSGSIQRPPPVGKPTAPASGGKFVAAGPANERGSFISTPVCRFQARQQIASGAQPDIRAAAGYRTFPVHHSCCLHGMPNSCRRPAAGRSWRR